MNKTILMGRLTKDPEVKYLQDENSTAMARYTGYRAHLSGTGEGKRQGGRPDLGNLPRHPQIGRASCRERV